MMYYMEYIDSKFNLESDNVFGDLYVVFLYFFGGKKKLCWVKVDSDLVV